jgi:hypothetical protein
MFASECERRDGRTLRRTVQSKPEVHYALGGLYMLGNWSGWSGRIMGSFPVFSKSLRVSKQSSQGGSSVQFYDFCPRPRTCQIF